MRCLACDRELEHWIEVGVGAIRCPFCETIQPFAPHQQTRGPRPPVAAPPTPLRPGEPPFFQQAASVDSSLNAAAGAVGATSSGSIDPLAERERQLTLQRLVELAGQSELIGSAPELDGIGAPSSTVPVDARHAMAFSPAMVSAAHSKVPDHSRPLAAGQGPPPGRVKKIQPPRVFTFLSGPLKNQRLQVPTTRQIMLGTDETCHLQIPAPGVCDWHCALRYSADGTSVRDLGSAIGTYVNGVAISEETFLKPGDVIQFGSVTAQLAAPQTVDQRSSGSRLRLELPMNITPGRPAISSSLHGTHEVSTMGTDPEVLLLSSTAPVPPRMPSPEEAARRSATGPASPHPNSPPAQGSAVGNPAAPGSAGASQPGAIHSPAPASDQLDDLLVDEVEIFDDFEEPTG